MPTWFVAAAVDFTLDIIILNVFLKGELLSLSLFRFMARSLKQQRFVHLIGLCSDLL